MRHFTLVCPLSLLLYSLLLCAQATPSAPPPTALRYDVGMIMDGTYSNDCFGVSMTIPDGWKPADFLGNAQGKAIHMPGEALELLVLDKGSPGLRGTRLSLNASPVRDPRVSAEDVSDSSARAQVDIDPQRRQTTRLGYPVMYGRRQFFRADYKQLMSNGDTRYFSFVFTIFRGYYIGETAMADSPAQLDEAVDLLKTVAFGEDSRNQNCVVGPDEYAGKWGIVGRVAPGASSPDRKLVPGERVRVSMTVSQALLITRIEPEYPDAALKASIHGAVILNVIIGPKGDVQEATAVNGNPLLLPAAIAAVKQWKYKPYLLAGQPVTMDTTVKVDFPPGK